MAASGLEMVWASSSGKLRPFLLFACFLCPCLSDITFDDEPRGNGESMGLILLVPFFRHYLSSATKKTLSTSITSMRKTCLDAKSFNSISPSPASMHLSVYALSEGTKITRFLLTDFAIQDRRSCTQDITTVCV